MEEGFHADYALVGLAVMIVFTLAALAFMVVTFSPPSKRVESLEGGSIREISTFLVEGEIKAGHFKGVLSAADWKRLGEIARTDDAKLIAEQLRARAVYGAEIFQPGATEPSMFIDTTRVMKPTPERRLTAARAA